MTVPGAADRLRDSERVGQLLGRELELSTAPAETVTPNRSRASSTIPRRETLCRAVTVTIAACNLDPNGEEPISCAGRALVGARQSRQRDGWVRCWLTIALIGGRSQT